ncbi:MAG: hypothetical protein U9R50_09850 [Campylobacterota bacterium]|nr:hypothetical protein [Campylobacterota bacterium]
MKYIMISVLGLLLISGCSRMQIATDNEMPSANYTKKIVVYSLENYTDTPQAGMRAANLAEGVLLARGYQVENKIDGISLDMPLDEKIAYAEKINSDYIFIGGVSEWRYKTGIDGEPAVSLQFKMLDVKSKEIIWSSTGSDNNWGNASVGTTAQALIESMIDADYDENNQTNTVQNNAMKKSQEARAAQLRLERKERMYAEKKTRIDNEKIELEQLVGQVQSIEDLDVKTSSDYQKIVELYKIIEDKEANIATLEASL